MVVGKTTFDVLRSALLAASFSGFSWGDPMERPLELVKQDLKNGYITLEQANRYYGLDKRSKSG